MFYTTSEKIKEDGTKYRVRLSLLDSFIQTDIKWRIDDIEYKMPKQRTPRSVAQKYEWDSEYRHLSHDGRKEYLLQKFIEFCGVDALNEALDEAWQSIKPKPIEPIKEKTEKTGIEKEPPDDYER